jgi:hypothetical protein
MIFSPWKLIFLCFVYLSGTLPSKGQTINQLAGQFSNDSPFNIESALKIFHVVDSLWQTTPSRAIKVCDSLVAAGESEKNIPLTIVGHFLYGSGVNDIATVEQHLSRASFLVKETVSDSSSFILDGYIEFLWGNYFLYKKSYRAIALQHLFKAELILEKHPSLSLLKEVKMQLASLTYNCGQYSVTLKECYELIDNKTRFKVSDKDLMLLNNTLGLTYSSQKDYTKSRFYFNSAFQYVKGDRNYTRFWNTLIKSNMANEYYQQKEYGNFIPLLKEDAWNCKILKDNEGLLNAYLGLARANVLIHQFKESSQYLDSVRYLAEKKNLELHYQANLAINSISLEIDLANQDYSQLPSKLARINLMNDTVTRALNRRMGENSLLLAQSSIMQDDFTRNNIALQKMEFQRLEQRNLSIFIVLIIVGIFISLYFWVARRNLKKTLQLNSELNHAKDTKTQMEAELKQTKLEIDRLSEEISLKKKQLMSHSVNIVQKNETLNEIKTAIKKIRNLQSESNSVKDILSGMMSSVNQNAQLENEWELFRIQFEEVDPNFFSTLSAKFPELSETDLRFCALFKLNLNSTQISGLLNITSESVKAARHRLRKKMKLMPNQNIHQFLTTELQ